MKKVFILVAVVAMAVMVLPRTAKAGNCVENITDDMLADKISSLDFTPTVINFEDSKIDPITGYWDTYGVKFTSENGKAIYTNAYNRGGKAKNVPTASGEYNLANNANKGQTSYNQPLKITFKEPVNIFGFYFGNAQNVKNATIRFYDQEGNELCSDVVSNYKNWRYQNVFGKPVTRFAGYSTSLDIWSVTLDYGPVYNSEAIDDLKFWHNASSPKSRIEKITLSDTATGEELGVNYDSYQKTNSYVQPEDIFIPNTVSSLSIYNTLKSGSQNTQYSFVMTHPLNSSVLYSETGTASWAKHAYFYPGVNHAQYEQYVFDSYRTYGGAYVYLYSFVKNNDGISEVPNMPVEVDDVSVVRLHLESLSQTPTQLSVVGNHFFTDLNLEPGMQDKVVDAYKFTANENEDITVAGLQFILTDENGVGNSNISSAVSGVSLLDGVSGESLTDLVPILSNNSVYFTNLHYVIPKSQSGLIQVRLNLNNFDASLNGKKLRLKLVGGWARGMASGNPIKGDNLIMNDTVSQIWTLNAPVVTSELTVEMKNTDAGFNKDRILLAGTSAWAGKIALTAKNEDIKVKNLTLTNIETSGIEDDVASVCLYRTLSSAPSNLIACRQGVDVNGQVIFDNINQVINIGTTSWYFTVKANAINNQANGTADSGQVLSFRVDVVAEGLNSANNVLVTYKMDNYTKKFVIAGTKISNVSMVNSYGGYTVDTQLQGTGEYAVAILAITTQANNNIDLDGNSLNTKLTSLRFDISKFVSTALGNVTIQKINGIDAVGVLEMTNLDSASNSGIAFTNNLDSLLPNDSKLESGTTSYFVVKANVNNLDVNPSNIDWMKFSMLDLLGSTYPTTDVDNNIDWNDGLSTFDGLLLDITSVNGIKIYE